MSADAETFDDLDDDAGIGEDLDDRYKLLGLLGTGSTCAVYKAKNKSTRKKSALKIAKSGIQTDENTAIKLRQEARVISALSHPGIVRVYDFGMTDDGRQYVAMELLEGKSIAQWVSEKGAMPIDLVVDVITQVCSALDHAHERGVVHRALNPDDILLVVDPVDNRTIVAKIIDFGSAQYRRPAGDQDTETNQPDEATGHALYMSPEQRRRGASAVDGRADIYALGCIMYFMATGQPPFSGADQEELDRKHLEDTPSPIYTFRPETATLEWLHATIAKAMAKQPDERYQTMRELAEALPLKSAVAEKRGLLDSFFKLFKR